jgi:hypothetical protein
MSVKTCPPSSAGVRQGSRRFTWIFFPVIKTSRSRLVFVPGTQNLQRISGTAYKGRPSSLFGNAKPSRNIRCESPLDMKGRTFWLETATPSDRERACKELRYHHLCWHRSEISPESNLDLRNTASSRVATQKGKNQTRDD